jgi:hypothetical protein
MACWVRPVNITDQEIVMSMGDGGAGVSRHQLRLKGNLSGDPVEAASHDGTANSSAATSTGYTAGAWHHICGIWSSDTGRTAYLDGGNSGNNTDSRVVTLSRTTIGASAHDLSATLNADVAWAAIWDVALTAGEVVMLAAGVHPLMVRPGALISVWDLYGNNDPETDYISGFDLTVTNSPAKSESPRIIMPSQKFYAPWITTVAAGVTATLTGIVGSVNAGTLSITGGAIVPITGVSQTGSAGNFLITGGAIVPITGVSQTGSAGNFLITGGAIVPIDGVSGTVSSGVFTVTGGATITITGVSAQGYAGDITVDVIGGITIIIDGVSGTASAGIINAEGAANIMISGASATGQTGTFTITGGAIADIQGIAATGQVDDVISYAGAAIQITGVASTPQVGVYEVIAGAQITVTGVDATGQTGGITISFGLTDIVLPGYRIYTITEQDKIYLIVEQDKTYLIVEQDKTYLIH